MEHIHIKIDEKLKKKAKLKAVEEGTSLTKLIIDFIKGWLKNGNKT